MLKLGTNNIDKIYLGSTKIAKAYLGDTLVYQSTSTPQHDYSQDYLTFEALESGSFTLVLAKDHQSQPLQVTSVSYSIDNGNTWVTTQKNTTTAITINTPTVNIGDKVLWKGVATTYTYNAGSDYASTFSSTSRFNVSGNIMSLLHEDNFVGKTSFPNAAESNFQYLFSRCNKLVSAKNLILPVTTLTRSCYSYMFMNCTSLTKAPELPATITALSCYLSMFKNCTSLTELPRLPATHNLQKWCYAVMFAGCTSIVNVPLDYLPCTNLTVTSGLGQYQYSGMFRDCTSLVTPPNLPATTLIEYCYGDGYGSYGGMFQGCTSLEIAPELPATTLKQHCYGNMFNGCTKLKYIKAMFTTTPSNTYTLNWVNGVSSTGTFVKNSAATWSVTGTNGVPSGWTVQTASS